MGVPTLLLGLRLSGSYDLLMVWLLRVVVGVLGTTAQPSAENKTALFGALIRRSLRSLTRKLLGVRREFSLM